MSVDRAFVVMTDGLTKEDAYVALTRARAATELHALAREPLERAEFAPSAEERGIGLEELSTDVERIEEGELAVDARIRSQLDRASTRDLVAELERHERARDDPRRRRAEALRDDLAETEARLAELREALERMPRRDPERHYVAASYGHTKDVAERLRAQERELPAISREPSISPEWTAAVERELAERRRAGVEIAVATEPAYVTEALGRKPEGLRERLEWERAVERLEELRQRLGVRDPQRALGARPRQLVENARWRAATRELERLRARVLDRGARREATRSAGIEIGL